MYRRLLLWSLLAFNTLGAADTSLTLDQAFGTVERANINVLISREAVAQASAAAEQQRSAILPKVTLDAQQRRSQIVQLSNGVATQNAPTDRFDGKLIGNFALLSPSQIASYRASRKGVAVAEFDYRQTLQTVLTSIAQTYFTHLRNQQRIAVLDANISRARALLDLARRQLDAGVATQIDVTRAEAQVAIAEQARLQQDTAVYQSDLQLKRLLDLDAGGVVRLADFSVRRVDQPLFGAAEEKSAFEQRADYLRTVKALEQSRDFLRAARFERLGSFSLFGEYGYASAEIFDDQSKKAWVGGADLSLPIFDGGRIGADKRVALAQLRAQEYRLRGLELVISSELRLAAQDARSRNAQVGVAERSLRLAEDELRLAQRRYEEGVADNREVIEAQNRLAVASDNLLDAVYLYNLSRVELARAKGEVRGILAEKLP